MKEEIISTESIFDGRIVHLKVHEVRLPDGNTSKREVIYHQGAAAIVAIDDNDHLLLVQQYRIGAKQVLYEIPAGVLEPDEDPKEAIIRELREETGYRPSQIQSLGGLFLTPGYNTEYIHLYYAEGYTYDPLEQDEDEFVKPVRIPFSQALEMIDNGEINEAKTIAGLLRVARLRAK
jgi:ADP-ribose pyrophosphatase